MSSAATPGAAVLECLAWLALGRPQPGEYVASVAADAAEGGGGEAALPFEADVAESFVGGGQAAATIQEKLRGTSRPSIEQVLSIVRACVRHADQAGLGLPADFKDDDWWREQWFEMRRQVSASNPVGIGVRPVNEPWTLAIAAGISTTVAAMIPVAAALRRSAW
jgi:hypothetical protein